LSTAIEESATASVQREATMFEKTRMKLIVMYSGLIACILLIMVVLFYFLLSKTISNSEEKQLSLTTELIQNEWNNKMPQPKPSFPAEATFINYDFIPLNQFFVLTTENGNVLFHSLRDEALLTFLKPALQQNLAASRYAQYTTFTFQKNRVFKFCSVENQDRSVLYIGMEVTDSVNLLSNMRWLLGLIAVLLLLVSIGMGYGFSKRAMIPIQRAYARQQDFVSDASHELRTPLSIMQASVEVLEEEQNILPTFHQKVLKDMKDELGRLTRMIEGLLTLARSDSGRIEITRDYFDLGEMVQSSSKAFKVLCIQKEIQITCSTDNPGDGNFMIYGDEERMKQLLYILLDNAIKYNKPGGEIEVRLFRKDHNAIIQVFDTGIGIQQKNIPYIFERFYRIDKGRSRSHGGVGLGLSIAAWIVEAHKGQIRVTSKLGEGTTVQIMLPAMKGDLT
jgi:signal transduction histidine kinase